MRALKISQQITKRQSESFQRYLNEIARISKAKTLTGEEEVELAERIKLGDKKAETELIERNLRFVVSVAKQYQNEFCPLEDLVSEGNIGLIKAAKKFDPARGFKFISYAVWWIRQSILCYLSDCSRTIRIPLNKINQINKIKKIQESFEQEYSRKPTTDEIVDILDYEIDSEELERLFSIDGGLQSLNAEIVSNKSKKTDGSGTTLEGLLIDYTARNTDENLEDEDLKRIVKEILSKMPYKHRTVIELYYGLTGQEPKTLDEIGRHLDLTRERIRQVKNAAIRYLGNSKNTKLMSPYMK